MRSAEQEALILWSITLWDFWLFVPWISIVEISYDSLRNPLHLVSHICQSARLHQLAATEPAQMNYSAWQERTSGSAATENSLSSGRSVFCSNTVDRQLSCIWFVEKGDALPITGTRQALFTTKETEVAYLSW